MLLLSHENCLEINIKGHKRKECRGIRIVLVGNCERCTPIEVEDMA